MPGLVAAFRRPAEPRRAALPRLSMHFLDWAGDEPALLLLHPNRTNSRVWDFVVDASTLPNRFVAPDQRGHGLSDYLDAGYHYDDYLADTLALLDALGGRAVHVVGAATGGNLALLLAARWPDRVRSLVVVDPGLSLSAAINERVQAQIAHEFRFPSLAAARAAMPFSERWSDAMKDHYARHSFAPVAGDGVEWRYHRPGVAETEHLLETPIWDEIRVTCPALIVRGAASEVFPPEHRDRLLAIVPGARAVEIDANHRVSQDNPLALAAAIDSFVSDVEAMSDQRGDAASSPAR